MVTSPNPARRLGEEEIDRMKVDRALKTRNALVDVSQRVTTGRAPTNDMISKALHVAEESLDQQKATLGPGGRKIAEDTKKALISTERFLQERNEGEHLQTIWEEAFKLRETSPIGISDAAKLKTAPTAMSHELGLARDTWHNGRYVILMLLNSGSFRSLITELLSIVSDALSPGGVGFKDETKSLKEVVSEAMQSTRGKLKAESFHLTDVQRENLRTRLQSVLQQLSGNLYFKRAVNSFFILTDTLKSDLAKTKEGTANVREKTLHSPELRNIMRELKAFFSQFVGIEALDRLIVLQKNLYTEVRGDEMTLSYFRDWRSLITRALDDPLILDQEEYREKLNGLFSRGKELNQKTRNWTTTKELSAAVKDAVFKISHDPINRQLTEDYRNLLKDVLFNEAGELSLNTEALDHLKNIFVPIVFDQLQYIPIPRIEKHRPDMDIIVDNLVFKALNLLPDMIQITSSTKMAVHPKLNTALQELTTGSRTHLKIKAKDIFVRLRDVRIWYKRHNFPKMEDDMAVDIDMKRMTLKIILDISKPPVAAPYQVPDRVGLEGTKSAHPGTSSVYGPSGEVGKKTVVTSEVAGLEATKTGLFRTALVESRIGKLKLRATSGQHHALFNLSTSLFASTIRHRVETAINLQILSAMDKINARLNQLMANVLPRMTTGMTHRLGTAVSGVGAAMTGVGSAVKGGAMQLKKSKEKAKQAVKETAQEVQPQTKVGGAQVPPPPPTPTGALEPTTTSFGYQAEPQPYSIYYETPAERMGYGSVFGAQQIGPESVTRTAPSVSRPLSGPNTFEQVFGRGAVPTVPEGTYMPQQPVREAETYRPTPQFGGKEELPLMRNVRAVETIILENPQTGETLIASATTMELPESSGFFPETQPIFGEKGPTLGKEEQATSFVGEQTTSGGIDQSSILQGRQLKHVEPTP